MSTRWACVLLVSWLCACGNDHGSGGADAGTLANRKEMTREQALDPKQCKNCHPNHYTEWASSMHAYAAKDPVFIAMNRRGQDETNGELGAFCVNCHAPMAVRENKVPKDYDTSMLPDELSGVTCYFCHNANDLDQSHPVMVDGQTVLANNPLKLSNDVVMRGPITDPKQPRVHRAEFSDLFNDGSDKSSALCGGCHDIVTPAGVHLERTYSEYQESVFSKSHSRLSCSTCHMTGTDNKPVADDPPSHVGTRTIHSHLWPGVDVALTDFPNRDAQKLAIQCFLDSGATAFEFDGSTGAAGQFVAQIETQAGHRQPSGASQDRRMWYEVLSYDESGNLLPDQSSGMIADGEVEDENTKDTQRWLFRDRIYDADERPVHMFWQAATSMQYPDGYTVGTMRTTTSPDPMVPHYEQRMYQLGIPGPARVVAHLRIRPMGMDVLEELANLKDGNGVPYLDPELLKEVPTFTLNGTETEWKQGDGIVLPHADPAGCPDSYMCLLQPGSDYCNNQP